MANKESESQSAAASDDKGSSSGAQKEEKPMEATGGNTPQERGMFKQLVMKFGERVGTVKTSDLTEEFIAMAKDADAYKETLFELSRSIMASLQHNPKYVHAAEGSTMDFEAPQGGDPYELLARSFSRVRGVFPNPKVVQMCERASLQMARAHRVLQTKTRKFTHRMRTFLNVTWSEWSEERERMMKLRQEMDFARHEYTKDANVGHKRKFEVAEAHFKKQYEKVFALLTTLPDIKEQHRCEIIYVLHELAVFNELCASAAQSVADLSDE